MARKEIGTKWDRENRNNMNDNFKELYNTTNNFVEKVSEEAFGKVIDASKLVWKEPVDSQSDLPSSASEGDTIMARDTGKVYRFDGSEWKEIQQIDASPINEVDERLSSQLAKISVDIENFISDDDVDDTSAFIRAMDFLKTQKFGRNRGGRLLFSTREYVIESTVIDRLKNVELFGTKNSIIKLKENTTSSHIPVFSFNESDDITISNLTFDGNNLTVKPLEFNNSNNIKLERLSADNLDVAGGDGVYRLSEFTDCEYVTINKINVNHGIAGFNGTKHIFLNDLIGRAPSENDGTESGIGYAELLDFNSCKHIYLNNIYGENFTQELIDMGACSDINMNNIVSINSVVGLTIKGETNRSGFDPGIYNININNLKVYGCRLGINLNTTVNIDGLIMDDINISNTNIFQSINGDHVGGVKINHSSRYSDTPNNINFYNVKVSGNGVESSAGVEVISHVNNFNLKDCQFFKLDRGLSLGISNKSNVMIDNCLAKETNRNAYYFNVREENSKAIVKTNNIISIDCGNKDDAPLAFANFRGQEKITVSFANSIIKDSRQIDLGNAMSVRGAKLVFTKDNIIDGNYSEPISVVGDNDLWVREGNTINGVLYDLGERYASLWRYDNTDYFRIRGTNQGIIESFMDTEANEIVVKYEPFNNFTDPIVFIQPEAYGQNYNYKVLPSNDTATNGEIRIKVYDNSWEEIDVSEANRMSFNILIKV